MIEFTGLTVVILATNERRSLRLTIKSIVDCCIRKDIKSIIVFIKSSSCPAADELNRMNAEQDFPVPIRSYVQKGDHIQHALAEIPALVETSHFMIMFSDFANNPASIPEMIEKSKQNPDAIVCASKWQKQSDTVEYEWFRKIGSKFVNRVAASIICSDGKDLFSIFQIYPLYFIGKYHVGEKFDFFFEYTLKPVAFGCKYIEIPTVYHKRKEAKSNYHIGTMAFVSIEFIIAAFYFRFISLRC